VGIQKLDFAAPPRHYGAKTPTKLAVKKRRPYKDVPSPSSYPQIALWSEFLKLPNGVRLLTPETQHRKFSYFHYDQPCLEAVKPPILEAANLNELKS
jgi:hypothetical protein